MGETLISRKGLQRAPLALLVSLLALSSAGAHVLAAPAHFEEWWGYGMLFLVTALLQALYGLGFLVREGRLGVSPLYLIGGILGTLLAMEMYVVGRTVLGIPLLGPRAAVGPIAPPIDVLSKVLELGLVATLGVMLVRLPGFKPSLETTTKLVTVGFLGMSMALVSAGIFAHEPAPITQTPVTPPPIVQTPVVPPPATQTPVTQTPVVQTPVTPPPVTQTPVTPTTSTPVGPVPLSPNELRGAPAQLFPNRSKLLTLLSRQGVAIAATGRDGVIYHGPGDGELLEIEDISLIYVPLLLYQMDGVEPPASSLQRPTAIFFMGESEHVHVYGIPTDPPKTFLRVDGGELIEPFVFAMLDGVGG